MSEEVKEESQNKKSRRSGWVVTGVIFLLLAAAAGIYFYTNSIQKNTAEPLQTIPANAAFAVQINNYDNFTKAANICKNYCSDMVSLGALDGMAFFLKQFDQVRVKQSKMAFSAHPVDGKLCLLLSVRSSEKEFSHLLQVLEINENNFHEYGQNKIYEIGTYHRTFVLCYHHGLFSVSENEKVLSDALDCIATDKCLAKVAPKSLRDMMDKNPKQNWLIINNNNFVESQMKNVAPEFAGIFSSLKKQVDWSAYQMTVNAGEIQLSGYSTMKDDSYFKHFEGQSAPTSQVPATVIPINIDDYFCVNISDAQKLAAKSSTAKSALQALNQGEIHGFTLSDSMEYHYFAVRLAIDTPFLQSLLPEGHTLDSVAPGGIYQFGRGDFASAVAPFWTNAASQYFLATDNCLVFSDSPASLQKYMQTLKKVNSLENSQIYINLKAEGRWANGADFNFFFQNGNAALDRYLQPELVSRKSSLRNTKYLIFNCLQSNNGLIPNNIYIRF